MSLKATNNVETNKYELEIEISAEDFEAAIEKAYLKARKNIAMPGFRKGKAPRKLIEKEYGEQVFFEDAVNLLYAPVVNGAVEESGLELVTRPEVEVTEISKENGVKLKATCITKPEVEVKDYKGIEVEKVVNPVTDEDINKQLDALREKNVTVETVDDRAAENGDDVVIDFEGFKDDVAFEGGKAEDFTLSLGSGQFIPGFEDQIVGHNAGEEFDINVTFPEEYQCKGQGYRTVRDQIHRLNLSCKMNRTTIQFHLGMPGQYLVQHCGTAYRSKLCINIDSGLLFA